MTLVPFTLPPLEPRVSGWHQYFVHWPFRRMPVSPWQTESPLIFIVRCHVSSSSWLWCTDLGSLAWVDTPCFSGVSRPAEISLQNPSGARVSRASFFASLPSLPASLWLLLLILVYKTWLFRLLSLYFNSSLVLGRGEYNIHLCHHHLGSHKPRNLP